MAEQQDDLQFERVELEGEGATAASPAGVCEACASGLDEYYEVNGKVLCPGCTERVRALRQAGGRSGRMLRALAFGTGAGALGAAVYYGVSALTGYEFGLIAILVGFMVGAAVRKGALGRGGWPYQLLAVGITYLAIVATYVPYVMEGLREAAAVEVVAEAGESVAEDAVVAEDQAVEQVVDELAGDEAGESSAPAVEPAAAEGVDTELTAAQFLLYGLLVLVVALIAPFLAGFQNFLGWLIIGFGLWQAWSMNKAQAFEVDGPYRLGDGEAVAGTG